MEIQQKYIAKDGMWFDDPIKCQEYEKTIGVLKGSVGALVIKLEELPADNFVHAMLIIKGNDGRRLRVFHTIDCAEQMEDYVNTENLTEEQRYSTNTIGDMISVLKTEDQDAACEFMMFWSSTRKFENCGMASCHNGKVWDKEEYSLT